MKTSNWASKLNKEINKAREREFSWGKFDCALFASDCIEAMTNHDPAESFRGKYETKKEAVKSLNDFAGSLEETAETIANREGYETIDNIDFIQRGDIVLVDRDNWNALGIWDGQQVLFPSKEKGLVSRDKDSIIKAWSIE